MIQRFYVNNYRTLVNFKLELGSFGLLCGPNGAGKSSVFDALHLVRALATGEATLGSNGDYDLTRLDFAQWNDSRVQEFELALGVDGKRFEYVLHLEQTADFERPRIRSEHASCDGVVLFSRDLEGVEFERKDGGKAFFPLDWRQAAMSAIQPESPKLKPLKTLREAIAGLLILRPNPRSMERESRSEARHPDLSLSNLIAWYRSLAQEQEWTDALRDGLREVWPDFRSFKMAEVGTNAKALLLQFDSERNKPMALRFDQLSDGERALVGLYMIRAVLEGQHAQSVWIDEPDNFVGLPELQPWLLSVLGLLDDAHQLVVISHHPEILTTAGTSNGHYLWRDNHCAPTRIGPLKVPDGMSPAEAIARGWAHGE